MQQKQNADIDIDIDDFKKYLKIDKLNLDEELINQPNLFFAVADACTELAGERDYLKENLATVQAELDAIVRRDAATSGEKTTEASISRTIQTDKKYISAFEKWLKLKEETDRMYALKEAFHMRSYMLRDLVSLFVSGQFEISATRGSEETKTRTAEFRKEQMAQARDKSRARNKL